MGKIKGYTPGPWTLGKGSVRVRREGNTSNMVAECYTTQNSIKYPLSKDERKANAHLIAAAPSLLEALEEADKLIREILDTWGIPHPEATLGRIAAAIAKAYGEEQ